MKKRTRNGNLFARGMFLLTCTVLFLLLPSLVKAQAQLGGQVKDTAEKRYLPLASVLLLRQNDSSLYRHTRAGENGKFSFGNLQPGKYVVFISCPKFVDYSDTIELKADSKIEMGEVAMLPKAKILEMAVVKQKIAAMRWKGDTLVIKADSIKVADDATVEDLLKRIPGFQVDKNGNIKAMGEKVEKVLVDGEEFFGDDPTIATRNLDARAVNEVELFDKKSDQAVFSGVDDGSKTKTINLKLKEDRKKGYFGKVQAATNGKELWDNNGMLNSFVGKRKISLYGVMSKTGKTGLSWGENMNYGNTGGMETVTDGEGSFYISGAGDDNEPNTDWDGRFSGNGIPKSWAGGVNYNNKWNEDRQTLTANFKYGKINTPAESINRSQYILPDTVYYINSNNKTFSGSTSQKVNLYSTLKLDSMSTLKITASAGYTKTNSSGSSYTESLNEDLAKVNTNRNRNTNSGTASSAAGTLFYSHNFKKLRRNLTVNAGFNNRAQESDGFQYAITDYFNSGVPLASDTVDQKKLRENDKTTFNAGATWSEPLGKRSTLQVSYGFNASTTRSIRNAYDNVGGKYETLNVLNSSDFKFLEQSNTVGMGYSVKLKKFFANLGNNVIFSHQDRKDVKQNTSRTYNFTNINPRMNLRYNPNKTTSLSVYMNGNTFQPTPDQLQPLQENSDPLNITIGNPLLKPAFTLYAYSWFNRYKPENNSGFNASLNSSRTWNSIVSKQNFDNQGRRITQFINQPNGNWSLGGNAGYGFKIKKTPFSLNMSAGYTVNMNTNYLNGQKNESRANTYSLNPDVQFEGWDKLYGNAGTELGWNKSSSSINSGIRPEYRTNRTYIDVSYNEPKKFSIGTDLSYNFRQKASPNDSDNEVTTWNAWASFKFKMGGKEKNWGLGLHVYDILNQNNGFKRSITATGVNESENVVLKRYFMARLTWRFAKNGKPAWD